MSNPSAWRAATIFLACAIAGPAPALAAGFALQEYSVRDMGEANAGFAAVAADASTVYSNPAGLMLLGRPQVTAGATGIFGRAHFADAGSRDAAGQSLAGGDGGEFLRDAIVPNLYAATPLSDRVAIGIGVTAPFGLATRYDDGWVGRYQAIRSKLTTIDINPAVAVRVTDWLSVGVGGSAQYMHVGLSNAVDFGAVCLGRIEPVAPGTCGPLGLVPQGADGLVALSGHDWSFGFNAGIMVELGEGTRIGAQYRSRIKHHVTGMADFTVPDAALPILPVLGGAFTDTGASATVDLPARASLSVYHALSPSLAIMADVTWTEWSRLQALTVSFDNPAQPVQSEPLHYRDTWRAALGAEFRLNDVWTLRAGGAWDQTPSREGFRSPRIPDNNRIVAAIGVSAEVMPGMTLDLAYNHIFIKDSAIDRIGAGGDLLVGGNTGSADLVALGATLAF